MALITRIMMMKYNRVGAATVKAYRRTFSVRSKQEIKVGDIATVTKTFTEEDIRKFADVTGDMNPIHVDIAYAKQSEFGACIVHGCLTLGVVSGLIAQKLPGEGSVLLKQVIEYPAPLMIGEEVEAKVELMSYRHSLAKLKITCQCQDGKTVLTGNALVKYTKKD